MCSHRACVPHVKRGARLSPMQPQASESRHIPPHPATSRHILPRPPRPPRPSTAREPPMHPSPLRLSASWGPLVNGAGHTAYQFSFPGSPMALNVSSRAGQPLGSTLR